MPTIRWLGPGVFTDHQRGYRFRPNSEHDIDDEDEAERLLTHDQFAHKFERVDDANEADAEDADETEDGSADDETSQSDDSDVTESDSDTNSRDELEAKEYSELQQLAMESENEAINGRSSREDIIDALADESDT